MSSYMNVERDSESPVLYASVTCGVIVLLLNVFRWTLVELLTPFLEPLLELGVYLAFWGIFVWSVVYFFRARKRVGIKEASAPFGVNLCIIVLTLVVPFTKITIKLDFRMNHAKRMQVVSAVLKGDMDKYISQKGGRGDMIHLPKEFGGLSKGGDDIMVYKRDGHVLVFFFTYRGILDNFSGFIYSNDNTKPQNDDFGGEFIELEQLEPNWYWAAST